MTKFTKGQWRKGKVAGAIVADTPPSMSRLEYAEEEKEYYGGYVIAESVSPENEPIIIAAPDLYKACKNALGFVEILKEHGIDNWTGEVGLRAALAKAEGRESNAEVHEG